MVYGDPRVTPLAVDIQIRLISFLSKLIVYHDNNKSSPEIYKFVHELHSAKEIKSTWVNIKELLFSLVFFFFFFCFFFFFFFFQALGINNVC